MPSVTGDVEPPNRIEVILLLVYDCMSVFRFLSIWHNSTYSLFLMKLQKAKSKIYARVPYVVVVIGLFHFFSLFCLNKPLIPMIFKKLYLLYPIVSWAKDTNLALFPLVYNNNNFCILCNHFLKKKKIKKFFFTEKPYCGDTIAISRSV